VKRRISHSVCDGSGSRRGTIAVIAMIAILITISIGLGLVQTALQSRRQALQWQRQKQAQWLAEAGIERAAAQLADSADYRGETWKLTADELGGRFDGEVRIELEPAGDNGGNNYQLTVVADYPAESEQRIRSRKTITIARQNSISSNE